MNGYKSVIVPREITEDHENIRMACSPAEIRTGSLPNINLKSYLFTYLAGKPKSKTEKKKEL
jgi:hypothetical protein